MLRRLQSTTSGWFGAELGSKHRSSLEALRHYYAKTLPTTPIPGISTQGISVFAKVPRCGKVLEFLDVFGVSEWL